MRRRPPRTRIPWQPRRATGRSSGVGMQRPRRMPTRPARRRAGRGGSSRRRRRRRRCWCGISVRCGPTTRRSVVATSAAMSPASSPSSSTRRRSCGTSACRRLSDG
ncbi:unnamed protein product [Phytomonas sp. EM1]|nr:unnamed protein product [Phytomonas sp. EM1]|eukprot:CCW63020.1 unnamed protein product [Phytomonas sp. isolate EM1]